MEHGVDPVHCARGTGTLGRDEVLGILQGSKDHLARDLWDCPGDEGSRFQTSVCKPKVAARPHVSLTE